MRCVFLVGVGVGQGGGKLQNEAEEEVTSSRAIPLLSLS